MKQFTFIAVIFLALGARTHAATLYFDPQERTIGPDGPFSVALLIDSEKPINAFDVRVRLPEGFEALDASDGNSIINYWIERPHYDAQSRTLSFSGLIPGGFAGRGGRLLVLSLQAHRLGFFEIAYDPKTVLYQNTPTPTPDAVTFTPLQLTVERGRENLVNQIPDADPPEPFTLVVATSSDPQRTFLIFETQDKGVGIAGYELAMSRTLTKKYDKIMWQKAESPFTLSDEAIRSYVYVRVTDKNGNARIEFLAPEHGYMWYEVYDAYIIVLILAVFLGLCFGLYVLIRNRHVS